MEVKLVEISHDKALAARYTAKGDAITAYLQGAGLLASDKEVTGTDVSVIETLCTLVGMGQVMKATDVLDAVAQMRRAMTIEATLAGWPEGVLVHVQQ